jgi:3-oxoacyl-[acyl-carrier protein] reductase
MKSNVIIAGAGKGIGYELTNWFIQNESQVIAISRDLSKVVHHPKLIKLKADITDKDTLTEKLRPLISKIDRADIHIYVYNVGLLINKPFLELSQTDIQEVLSVNFLGACLSTQALIPWLLEAEHAHVVFIGSMGGFQGSVRFPGLSVYSAAKSALASLSESLAEEFKHTNISFNTLALGAVDTEMLRIAFPDYKAKISPSSIASFIGSFALKQFMHFNGKVLPVAQSNP